MANYVDVTDKVNMDSVTTEPWREGASAAFDGNLDTDVYYTAYWNNSMDSLQIIWEMNEPVAISAYRFIKFNEGGLVKEDGTKNSWIVYGYNSEGGMDILAMVDGINHTTDKGMTDVFTIDSPNAYSKYQILLMDTSKLSGAGNKDQDEWGIGEIKLYAAK